MKIVLFVTCPYCGNKFHYHTTIEHAHNQEMFVLCDIDESAGCDSLFAIKVKPEFHFKTYKMDFVPPVELQSIKPPKDGE